MHQSFKNKYVLSILLGLTAAFLSMAPASALNLSTSIASAPPSVKVLALSSCGGPGEEVKTSIDIGCKHKGNAITDATFAIIRFLSYGVGLVIVASLIVAGLQYTASRDDPKAVAAARERIYSNVVALLIFIFGYAILNFIIPRGFFN